MNTRLKTPRVNGRLRLAVAASSSERPVECAALNGDGSSIAAGTSPAAALELDIETGAVRWERLVLGAFAASGGFYLFMGTC